jgi:uncharacterized protein (DUF2249 family)
MAHVIAADVTLARLLEERPELLDVLVRFHPHFAQLRNGMLRKLMGSRVTLGEAARVAGVSVDALLAELRRAAGEAEPATGRCPEQAACGGHHGSSAFEATPRPAVLTAFHPVELDVRDDIRRGAEPFARIMSAVKGLAEDEALVLRTPFEPVPLYDVLGRRGLEHWTERHEATDWSIWFYRADVAARSAGTQPRSDLVIDVRDLEPPQPMVLVLQRLDTLAPGEILTVIHGRRPMFLYPQLDERGFLHDTDEPEPGMVRIRIRHGRR